MSDNIIQLNSRKLWCECCGKYVSRTDTIGDNFHAVCKNRLLITKPENSDWRDTPYLEAF